MPIRSVKIRVTLKDWKNFMGLHSKLKQKEHYDASYIFVKLVQDNAFQHCLFESEVSRF